MYLQPVNEQYLIQHLKPQGAYRQLTRFSPLNMRDQVQFIHGIITPRKLQYTPL
jgi:hypothetical protein